jgi:hypothetical protein
MIIVFPLALAVCLITGGSQLEGYGLALVKLVRKGVHVSN